MLPKKVVKAVAIVLACLMIISVGAVAMSVFAFDAAAVMSTTPVTGDSMMDYILPICIFAIAVVIVIACVVLPKLKKK